MSVVGRGEEEEEERVGKNEEELRCQCFCTSGKKWEKVRVGRQGRWHSHLAFLGHRTFQAPNDFPNCDHNGIAAMPSSASKAVIERSTQPRMQLSTL